MNNQWTIRRYEEILYQLGTGLVVIAAEVGHARFLQDQIIAELSVATDKADGDRRGTSTVGKDFWHTKLYLA